MTPFELLIGTKMRDKNDDILKLIQEENLEKFEDQRLELREKAKQNIQKIQEENRKVYNKKRTQAIQYEIGDLVAIKRTQFKKKNDRYVVRKIGNGEGPMNTTSSADLMKPWSNGDEDEVSHSSGSDE
ncbi:hypothetical protein K1T71_013772 [Dendrolimus kikuchii]|uniref:Uncharacterized protein n=1 Tax=Dendrolimus kikuchii TaxID=765133 RepID=A0ACC1CFQ7_9NEOP|nr:hypothetical protein K1T71_013772 [Dendrolimus kikuchii]